MTFFARFQALDLVQEYPIGEHDTDRSLEVWVPTTNRRVINALYVVIGLGVKHSKTSV